MSNEIVKKRIKEKLDRLQPYVDMLDKMEHEACLQVFASMDSVYDYLSFLNDKALDGHIVKFDERLKEIDEALENANKAVIDVFKRKIELYQKAHKTLMSDL